MLAVVISYDNDCGWLGYCDYCDNCVWCGYCDDYLMDMHTYTCIIYMHNIHLYMQLVISHHQQIMAYQTRMIRGKPPDDLPLFFPGRKRLF